MPTELDLARVHAKLKWARGHFEVVNGEISAWLKSNPHLVVFNRNQHFTKFWLTIRLDGPKPDFERWSFTVGDCVTNLRDTLDHLIYAIAHLPSSPNPAKSDLASFIIRDLEVNFIKDARSRLLSVPDSVKNSVRRFQPFERPDTQLPPLLGILAELANQNKHKMLSLMMTTPSALDINLIDEGATERQEGVTFDLFRGDLQDGSPMAIWQFPRPAPNLKFNPNSKVSLQVAIRHKALQGNTAFDADRTSYDVLLRKLFVEVEFIIGEIAKLV